MERMVFEAIMEGNVTSFLGLFESDPLILDRILVNCFNETPLHVASMLGHEYIVMEILIRKPELAQELNSQRFSPLHLASAKGYVGIVKALLSKNSEMCLARDRDGRNSLHLAAIKGHVDVLKELLHARPQAARETVDRGETILHLCVSHYQLETLKLLVATIDDFYFVNSKDDYGNTILHLAVDDKQIETIEFLLTSTRIEVNVENLNGLTALDILVQSRRGVKDMDIVESLRAAGAVRSKDNPLLVDNNIGLQSASSLRQKQEQKCLQKQDEWLEKKRNTLMVVASLMATMAFQAGLNPTGGVWQDNSQANLASPSPSPKFDQINPSHKAGSSIMASNNRGTYDAFIVSNTIGFIASLSIILLLISGLPFRTRFLMGLLMGIMWIAVSAMYVTYVLSILAFTPYDHPTLVVNMLYTIFKLWNALISLLVLGHIIRLILKIKKKGTFRMFRLVVVIIAALFLGCFIYAWTQIF